MQEAAAEDWVPFTYRDFYDVPRSIAFVRRGHCYFLDCVFDDGLDDYGRDYEVFELPFASLGALPDDWENITASAGRRLGSVPVTSVRLDNTRRKLIEASIVDRVSAD